MKSHSHRLIHTLNECSHMHSATKTRHMNFIGISCQGRY